MSKDRKRERKCGGRVKDCFNQNSALAVFSYQKRKKYFDSVWRVQCESKSWTKIWVRPIDSLADIAPWQFFSDRTTDIAP